MGDEGKKEREVLQQIWEECGGSTWVSSRFLRARKGWESKENDLSKWYGIKTNNRGCIIKISLCSQLIRIGLTGSIPPSVGSLTFLKELSLYNNKLSGEVPKEIGNLFNIEKIDLSLNDLTGLLPEQMGSLSELRSFSVYGNNITDNPGTLASRREVAKWQQVLVAQFARRRELAKALRQANEEGFSSHPCIVAK